MVGSRPQSQEMAGVGTLQGALTLESVTIHDKKVPRQFSGSCVPVNS